MSKKQETVADIEAEMRGLVKPGETLEHTYELLNGLAVRIEAAHKREVATAENSSAVGNGAKMREVLEQIRQKAIATIPGSSIQKRTLDKFRLLASAALAAPPRNCDRFGTDNAEALLAYEEVCEKSETEESIADAFSWLFSLADNTKGDVK